MINLINAIREIEKHGNEIDKKYAKERENLNVARQALVDLNEACYRCNGCGKIHSRATAECDVEERKCPDCNGTGNVNRQMRE